MHGQLLGVFQRGLWSFQIGRNARAPEDQNFTFPSSRLQASNSSTRL
jgi:hypothetical protein